MWATGVIVFILLGGYFPFNDEMGNQKKLFKLIKKGQFEFHPDYWGSVSDDAKDLISRMLTKDPTKRITAAQALNHRWLTLTDDVLAQRNLDKNLKQLKRFNAKRKFRAAVKALIAVNRFKNIMKSFQKNLAKQIEIDQKAEEGDEQVQMVMNPVRESSSSVRSI